MQKPIDLERLKPMPSSAAVPYIDASLARGIRRAYFRELLRQWSDFKMKMKQASRRNMGLGRPIDSDKQLRERCSQMEKMLGPLIP